MDAEGQASLISFFMAFFEAFKIVNLLHIHWHFSIITLNEKYLYFQNREYYFESRK